MPKSETSKISVMLKICSANLHGILDKYYPAWSKRGRSGEKLQDYLSPLVIHTRKKLLKK